MHVVNIDDDDPVRETSWHRLEDEPRLSYSASSANARIEEMTIFAMLSVSDKTRYHPSHWGPIGRGILQGNRGCRTGVVGLEADLFENELPSSTLSLVLVRGSSTRI